MATDEEPTIQELYLYFTHFFMSSIQDTVLKPTVSYDLYWIIHDKVSRFVKEEERRQDFLAWSKNYL